MTKANSSSSIFPIRVLIVDDHPNTATMLARAIAQLGPKVDAIAATSAKEALEKVKGGAADILITDMIMPEMNGLELIEKLQNHPAGRPRHTILITAYDVPGLKETARRLKVNEIIAKPVRPELICQAILHIVQDWSRNESGETREKQEKKVSHILVADDLPDNVSLLTRYLENEGYRYSTAFDGVETLEKARAELPDLILLDINMPRKDGFTVLKELREDPTIQHIPVIILTAARIDPVDVQSGLTLGADDYVTKPFDRRELMARIRTKLRVKEAEDVIRRRNRELNLLPQIGKELSARIDIEDLSTILLKRTVETLGALLGYLVILNKNGPYQKTYHLSDTILIEEMPLPQGLLQTVSNEQQGFIIDDARSDPRWAGMPSEQIRCAVVVPLFGRHELLGLLILAHEEPGYFNIEHMLLLQAIASQAAIAVENAHLFSIVSYEQKRLAALLRSANDVVLMFDTSNSLTMINPAGERLFSDYAAQLGLPLARGKGYDALIALLEQTYQAASPQTGEVVWPDQRVFAAMMAPIEDGGCAVTLHDITHFRKMEQVKNEFIASASHDLKNPITSITGYAQLLAQAGPLNADQQEFVGRIQSASKEMDFMVHDLLEMAKVDLDMELKKDEVNLIAMLEETRDEFQAQTREHKLSLNFKKNGHDPTVRGDATQLRKALKNLVGNAIKYTPNKGNVMLSLETQKKNAIIKIKDDGNGIDPEDLPLIFNRFYRTRKTEQTTDIEGHGLGLAIVKSIVEKHGGVISVESEPGKGTCFTFSLPLMIDNAPIGFAAHAD